METGIRLTPGCLPLRGQTDGLSLIKVEHPGRGTDLHTITNSALYVLSLSFPRQNQTEPPCRRRRVGDDGDEAFKERGSGKTVWLNVKPRCSNIFSRSQGRKAREEDWRETSKTEGEPESFRGTQRQVGQTRTEIVYQLGD